MNVAGRLNELVMSFIQGPHRLLPFATEASAEVVRIQSDCCFRSQALILTSRAGHISVNQCRKERPYDGEWKHLARVTSPCQATRFETVGGSFRDYRIFVLLNIHDLFRSRSRSGSADV